MANFHIKRLISILNFRLLLFIIAFSVHLTKKSSNNFITNGLNNRSLGLDAATLPTAPLPKVIIAKIIITVTFLSNNKI